MHPTGETSKKKERGKLHHLQVDSSRRLDTCWGVLVVSERADLGQIFVVGVGRPASVAFGVSGVSGVETDHAKGIGERGRVWACDGGVKE